MTMTRNKAHDLSGYVFSRDEPILLDANVWLYLNPAPSGKRTPFIAHKYGNGLKAMLSAGVQLMMDAVVLSEYLNAYCRIEWRALYKSRYPDFKAFRQSVDFPAVGSGAATYARLMLRQATRHDHPFATLNVSQVLAEFEAGSNDFNDGLLTETCRLNNWKLVTNDGDFTSGGIEILTTNPKLLTACP